MEIGQAMALSADAVTLWDMCAVCCVLGVVLRTDFC